MRKGIIFTSSQSNNALALSERFQMRAQKLNFHALTKTQSFQLEQAIAVEAGCNMADVRFSHTENFIYVHFFIGEFRQCAIINPNGEYYEFRESIRKPVKEAIKLAA